MSFLTKWQKCNAFLSCRQASSCKPQSFTTHPRLRMKLWPPRFFPLHLLSKYARTLPIRKMSNFSEENKIVTPVSGIAGVVFDMDGTLVKPCIDFADMRKRIYDIADSDSLLEGNTDRGDVLELYQMLSPSGKIRADEVFSDIERKAIIDMKLMDGAGELCKYLDSKKIRRAVLTRNVCAGIDAMHDILWEEASVTEFYPAVSRNTKGKDGKTLSSKPAPDGILHICNIWKCSPQQVIMVGDSSADDIAAASRANCAEKVLIRMDGKDLDNNSGDRGPISDKDKVERQPSLVVSSLGQLLNELKIADS